MISFLTTLRNRILEDPQAAATPAEALYVARMPRAMQLDILATAQLVRSAHLGTEVATCGIVNAKSGRCSEDCAFCAQSGRHHAQTAVYPLMPAKRLFERARELSDAGVARFGIVTSGNTLAEREFETLCDAARRIRAALPIALCCSLGQLTPKRAQKLKDAGFLRYHHNLETAASFFPAICTTHEYKDDVETVRCARAAGLEVCSGGIFGLGESWEQRVEMAQLLRELDVTAIPVNFLTPIPGTPLGVRSPLPPHEALRILAVYRLMHPTRHIYVCGGRRAVLGEWRTWIHLAGANGVMTGDYLTTKGCSMEQDDAILREMGARA